MRGMRQVGAQRRRVLRGLRRKGEGGGVGSEKIDVHQVPRADIEHWLQRKGGEGVLIDLKVWTGLYFLVQGAVRVKR